MIIKSVLVVPSVSLQDNSPVTKWPGWPLYSPQTPSSCYWPFAGAQIRRLSATGSGESSRWSLWRSGLALFNTASTSNNSRLWQLCIIHLVESLSLSSLTLLSASPLSVSLQFFCFFVPPSTWRRGEGEPGQCSIRCCLFPPDTSDFGDTEVFVCSVMPKLWILDAIWTRLCSFFIEAQCLNSSLQQEL